MGLKSDLETKVKEVFSSNWEKRDGNVIPDDSSLSLGNVGVELDATVLYADLSGSTSLVDSQTQNFSAEIYKTFLHCAAKIIGSEDGVITAYDGDRVMAVFIGGYKNSSAVKAALKIQWAVSNIINPGIVRQYGANKYTVKQVVGIDTSKLMAAKTGIRGANDLVWVGRSANYAAKLCNLNNFPTYITDSVYKLLSDEAKLSKGVNMWNARTWTDMNNMTIYGSTYQWTVPE
jgi:class 3 adenylate cyclase